MEQNKATALIGLLQVSAVILGTLSVGIIMKINGYPSEDPTIKWSPFSIWLRSYGLVFMIIPIIWILSVSLVKDLNNNPKVVYISGTLTAALILVFFIYHAITSFGRTTLINAL